MPEINGYDKHDKMSGIKLPDIKATLATACIGMADNTTRKLREICLRLPEAAEKEAWGDPTWRVRDKIFAMEKRGDGRCSLWCKAQPGSQEILIGADPDRFFVPPYVGHKGWIGVRLDQSVDWEEVAELIKRSYRLIAPKRLATLVN